MSILRYGERILMSKKAVVGYVKKLKEDEIYVFPTDATGQHRKGMARRSLGWGSELGIGEGMRGATYAIPVRESPGRPRFSVSTIKGSINNLLGVARNNPTLTFLVMELDDGTTGELREIAPLFESVGTVGVSNVRIPKRYYTYIRNSADSGENHGT